MSKITVLVSGNGSNLQSIIDAIEIDGLQCEISAVIADRQCYALERAKLAKIPTFLVERKEYREKLSAEIAKLIDDDCELIVLAGFLSILNEEFTHSWQNKIINIHPSLLPKYGGHGMWGMKVHEAVIANRETESGCTIHFVNDEIDAGEIIHQEKVRVLPEDTAEHLQAKIRQIEHIALTTAIKKILNC